MSRRKYQKTSMTLERETIEALDEIAGTFEDHIPRGELVDAIVEWATENEDFDVYLDETFGSDEDESTAGDESDEAESK